MRKTLLFACLILGFIACKKDGKPASPSLSLSETEIQAGNVAFKDSFQITANGRWEIVNPSDWLSVAPGNGTGNATVILSADENNDLDNRTVTLQIKTGAIIKNVSVTQAARVPLAISVNEINGVQEAFKDTVQITTSSEWTLSIPSSANWLTVSQQTGSGSAGIVFSAEANPDDGARTAIIKIATKYDTKTVTVTQEGKNSEAAIPGWNLIFYDEFNTTGNFDNSRWSFCPRTSTTTAWVKYLTESPDYASLDGSNLVLKLDNAVITGDNVPYHSGGVQSKAKFNFTYGKVEVRAKFNQGQGAWPAIWMMPENPIYGGWPNSGEIDIMEHINYEGIVYQTVHNGAVTGSGGGSSASHSASYNVNDYNVYGLEWSTDALKFYVNGTLQYTYNKPTNATSANWPYDQPFYLILNQSGGAGWPGAINNADLPFSMKVDWVRVYKKQ